MIYNFVIKENTLENDDICLTGMPQPYVVEQNNCFDIYVGIVSKGLNKVDVSISGDTPSACTIERLTNTANTDNLYALHLKFEYFDYGQGDEIAKNYEVSISARTEIDELTKNAHFTIIQSGCPKYCFVTWNSYDGETSYFEEPYFIGETPSYTGETPEIVCDEGYICTFSGWTTEPNCGGTFYGTEETLPPVSANTDYYACFTRTIQSYTVTFLNYDGTQLASSSYTYNSELVYDGETPTKPDDTRYTYNFAGWSDDTGTTYQAGGVLPNVTRNVTYTALFVEIEKEVTYYTIKWVDGNGDTLYSTSAKEGENPPAYEEGIFGPPTKRDDDLYSYTFNGTWTPDISLPVTGDTTYTALFNPGPLMLRFNVIDGTYRNKINGAAVMIDGTQIDENENESFSFVTVKPTANTFTVIASASGYSTSEKEYTYNELKEKAVLLERLLGEGEFIITLQWDAPHITGAPTEENDPYYHKRDMDSHLVILNDSGLTQGHLHFNCPTDSGYHPTITVNGETYTLDYDDINGLHDSEEHITGNLISGQNLTYRFFVYDYSHRKMVEKETNVYELQIHPTMCDWNTRVYLNLPGSGGRNDTYEFKVRDNEECSGFTESDETLCNDTNYIYNKKVWMVFDIKENSPGDWVVTSHMPKYYRYHNGNLTVESPGTYQFTYFGKDYNNQGQGYQTMTCDSYTNDDNFIWFYDDNYSMNSNWVE